jgi:NAD-dependent deacetylase sirtuin 5
LKSKISLFRSPDENGPEIDEKDLPRCRKCQSLLRPHIVWFGEQIWSDVSEKIGKEIQLCDLFLVVCFPFFSC